MAEFDVVKAAFWRAGSQPPPLTDDLVAEAEQLLGVPLPADLLELLRIQNGGSIADAWQAFPIDHKTSWSHDHVPFDELMGISHRERRLSMLDTPYLVNEWGLPSPIVLLWGEGHYWIGLDYRAGGPVSEPSVTWFDLDIDLELPLAPNFRVFVEGLVPSGTFEP